jgi:hypothetical protein
VPIAIAEFAAVSQYGEISEFSDHSEWKLKKFEKLSAALQYGDEIGESQPVLFLIFY